MKTETIVLYDKVSSLGLRCCCPILLHCAGRIRSGEGRLENEMGQCGSGSKKRGDGSGLRPRGNHRAKVVTERFSKAFPEIKIEFSGGRGNDLAAKVRAERDAGVYTVDIVVQGTTTANLYFKPLGLLPIEPILMLPEVSNLSNWRDNALDFSDKDRLNLVYAFMVKTPLVYNFDQVRPDEVDEVQDLLNPKWNGKIVLGTPSRQDLQVVRFAGFGQYWVPRKRQHITKAYACRPAPSIAMSVA